MSRPIIKVESLVKTYKKGKIVNQVIKGITFELFIGDFVGLSGPSGSGKSTILNHMGLLDKPTSGRIIIEGKDTGLLSERDKAMFRLEKIGFVFQKYELIPELTALENVFLPLVSEKGFKKSIINSAKEILNYLDLSKRINHYPSELSGGEQQRISIARAIVKNPVLILADEPTANLDSVSGTKIMEILKTLNKKFKMTILIVNHEKAFEKYFEKMIRIKDGELIKIEKR
jgi:putative ABC transport system ATP-binding protein